MKQRIAFIFPGQGAQTVGMSKDLFDQYSAARACIQEAEEILQEKLSTVMFEGPVEELTQTRNSQCAIFVHSMAVLAVLTEQFPELKPSVCSGLSLGEYSALAASGRLSFEETLPLVQWRGQVMNDACEATDGTMAVVMGLPAEEVETLVAELALPHDLWAANFNCPGQVVVSGTQRGIDAIQTVAKERGAKRVLPLQVHGAFHSGLMVDAERRLAPRVREAQLSDSDIGFVMNVPGDFVASLDEIRNNLIAQVTHPVRWQHGIEAMRDQVDLFIEIGPGKTLAGMNKRIGVESTTVSVGTVADLEQLQQHL